MSGDQLGTVTGAATPLLASAAAEAAPASERQRIADAAVQFEAMFLLQMLKQMRQSMLDEDDAEPGFGASTMFDTIDSELARTLAGQGTGLAPVLIEGLTRNLDAVGTGGRLAAAGAGGGAAAAPTSLAPAVTTVPGGGEDFTLPLATERRDQVSSAFGWRRDPLNGSRRFHAGVDLRGAYGEGVPVAAGGRVVFAGEQGGYGQSVVVEHAPGLQTRYAHLSAISVRPGDQVPAGSQVGRVGQSGRATGPHLHFEVLEQGRRVDPATGAARLAAALKLQRPVADSPAGSPGTAMSTPGADE